MGRYKKNTFPSSTKDTEPTPPGINIPQMIRRYQKLDNNFTGNSKAPTIPNPLSPILEADTT
ncbi:hypothetical protein N7472_009482 [Penicillium cf. griseofulvum]|uniref:Uncharacterized protein n=1 Tax=Penicillium cf. griseofulvum TaxID=2972120 RepID=A0A9W9M1Z6_9EURO|nr:hypothetical protein N7472_009482 [Penicillium cf. griseofulvum]